ncbi:helix-turn-helix domain-containing protein [Aerococcaceae bacterium zg-ZUI334]|uniref:AraC family transcriptional regulator n=1 Tax=Aerococcaceae TaxID=186827 RepID=UPI0013B69C29|nr:MULTISPECIES: AraC family transcriptional regulator [unclassified Facklamia]MBR7928025.1 helix-turn-helix domain-containing protein [Aerococcaceae bacterium zg-ZUI334]MBS4462919.1 helix-turn-helix domain-containing protein [Aerococcaceae bacterium zg-B36]QQD65473.1 helix-turn-helix domain-containing protein [Aerococcaceae bacterium zg-252]NEW65075.1 helix-turn-helix domain-containing protein [Facklamia sp. 252]NEW68679.1 helix-turn-helix domain-containing protein [Facklamia sp. 253]
MKMTKIRGSRINTMISDQFEIWHVEDEVTNEKAIYHYHDYYEIHATLTGTAEFFIEGEIFTISPGTILLIHSNDLHRILKQNSDYFERVYIFVTPYFLEKHSTILSNLENAFKPSISNNHRSKVIKVSLEVLKEQLHFVTETSNNANKQEFGSEISLENRVVDYIVEINRWVNDQENVEEINGKRDSEMEGMINYVSENLISPSLTLEDMESHFFINKYHIIREFKKYTGLSFYQYVLKRRLLLSKQLLLKNPSAIEVFSECGFASYTNFLRAFKKEFSMTPKEFLKQSVNDMIRINHM